MTTKDTGGPAFPTEDDWTPNGDLVPGGHGMSLRDWFAGKALMGMMASRNPTSPRFHPADDAAYVYAVADAMLAERNEQ